MLRPQAVVIVCPDCLKNYEAGKYDKEYTCPYCNYIINAELEREKQAELEAKEYKKWNEVEEE